MRLHVPLRDDVTIIVIGAYPAEGAPNRVALDRRATRTRALVANCVGDVHPLDNLGVAHGHVCVRGSVRNTVVGEAVADSKEIEADAVSHSRSADAALFHSIHYVADGAFGNTANRVSFVKTILRLLW